MEILYGGAFNPPTIAHKQIVLYLLNKYDCTVTVMPTNDRYKNSDLIPFKHRFEMLEILFKKEKRVLVSDFELKQNDIYLGTCDTLRKLNHPLFVIGADQLNNINTWINFNSLVKENNFIVFPRNNFDINKRLNEEDLKDYKDHFIVIDDFDDIPVSSTSFRQSLDSDLVDKKVFKYIKRNKLYM